MMKKVLLCMLFCALPTVVSAQNYILKINGNQQVIDLGQAKEFMLPDGTKLQVELSQPDFLTFQGQLFRFKHRNEFKPTRTDLGSGIFQTMIMTPLGTGVMVQEYTTMDPSGNVDLMLNELTKEEVEYGYTYSEKKVDRNVSGRKFSGKEATTVLKNADDDEEWTRSVWTTSNGEKGLLIVTFIEKANYRTESHLIDKMWETIEWVP